MGRLQTVASRLGLDPRAMAGAAVLLGGALLWVLAFTGGFASLFSSSTATVRADFASVEDIVPNDPVRIKGVQVGTVGAVTPDPGGRGATLTLNLDSTAGTIYRDASASILWRTALGANDAVALDPGTRPAGPLGGATIPQSQDSNQVELDQVTEAFHGTAQDGIRTMLQQLGPALSAHPALGLDLNVLTRIAPQAAVGIGALRGATQDTDLRNLVRNAGQAAQALTAGTNGSDTRQFVQSAATTLTSVAAEQSALRQTLQGFAVDLPLLTTTFTGTQRDLVQFDPLLTKLTNEVPQVGPTLAAVHPALSDLHNLLTDATPLLQRLHPTVDSLATTARVGVPVIDQLAPSMQRLAQQVLPGLAEKSPEEGGRPAYTEIGPVFVGLGTLADSFDENGNFGNLTAGLGQYSSQQVLPCQLDFSGTDYIVCQSLAQALGDFFGGGSSLLRMLASRPDGAGIYGPLLKNALSLESQLNASKHALSSSRPSLAKWLFDPNHGGVK